MENYYKKACTCCKYNEIIHFPRNTQNKLNTNVYCNVLSKYTLKKKMFAKWLGGKDENITFTK